MTTVNTSGLPIGRVLKVERTAAGLSLTAVATAVGISVGHLSNIEAGRRRATAELLEAIRDTVRKAAA